MAYLLEFQVQVRWVYLRYCFTPRDTIIKSGFRHHSPFHRLFSQGTKEGISPLLNLCKFYPTQAREVRSCQAADNE